jgi:hypothetical protein
MEQENFVRELTHTISGTVIHQIRTGMVPADWDSHYLREYLYDCFESARSRQLPQDRKMRVKYRNDVVEHNL